METPARQTALLFLAALLCAAVPVAAAQNIYKCTKGGQLTYTDRPCLPGTGKLIHQADDSEIIDQYLRLGQLAQAKQYAQSRQLDALYQQRLAAHQQTLDERAQREADDADAVQQRDEQARQQALADEAAASDRLQAENEALRQQNDDYRDQLSQPVYNGPPAYWGGVPPYGNGQHGHRPPLPSKEPIYHPCKQLAGGRVEC